jgi:hypothetical protein
MTKVKNTTAWTLALLDETFGLQQLSSIENMPALATWLSAKGNLSEAEKTTLADLQLLLMDNVDDWDEEDLKMNFIVFILKLTNYVQYKGKYRVFFEKYISANIQHHTLSSRPDMMLAKGIRNELRLPYFCFHEYKKSQPDKDPRGQLIQDMLIAQSFNQTEQAIYGCYVTGRHWYFVVLKEKKYKISRAYDATEIADLYEIVYILKYFWVILEEMAD